jgi:HlyD family secretion protein
MSVKGKSVLKRLGIFAAAAVILAVCFFLYTRRAGTASNTGVNGLSFTVTKGDIRSKVSAIGTVYASDSRDITVPSGSTVTGVKCTEGQIVKNGDVLFMLKNEGAQIDLKKAKLALSQLQNRLQELKSSQAELIIYSPVQGRVKSVNVSQGDEINRQANYNTIVAQIEDASSLTFSILTSDCTDGDRTELEALAPGREVQAEITGIGTRTLKVLSVSGGSPSGKKVVLEADNTSGMSAGAAYDMVFKLSSDVAVSGLEASGKTVDVRARQSGTVTAVHIKAGDTVEKNKKIIETSSDSIINDIQNTGVDIEAAQLDVKNRQDVVDALTVKAPVDGMVFNIKVTAGDEVGVSSSAAQKSGTTGLSSGNAIASIENRTSMQVKIPVDELDIGKIKVGQESEIIVDAFKDRVYKGRVLSIAPKGTVQNGVATFEVVIDIEKQSRTPMVKRPSF